MGADPKGIDRDGERHLYFFIHNVYANFFKDSLDYLSLHLYPRFEHRVVGTYDKAVEYIQKTCQYGRETDKPQLPALILNPSGEFDIADANAGGKQYWRFPNLAPGMVKRLFDPIYQDENVLLTSGFIRMQGDLELIMLLNSFYEYCDLKMLLLQVFGGFDRWIYPQFFTTFIILPEEIVNYEYTNPYTGLDYKLDWSSAGAYEKLVKTTARNELVVPCNIKPIYKLTSISDASTRYGGADSIADWRLGATIRYEIEIPSFLDLQTDYLAKEMNIRINAGSAFSAYTDYTVPTQIISREVNKDWGLDETSNSTLVLDGTCVSDTSQTEHEYEFHVRYYHIIDSTEAASITNVSVAIPEQIDDLNGFIVNSKYGEMHYGDHYILTNNNNTLELKVKNVDLEEGMVIELYVYKRIDE